MGLGDKATMSAHGILDECSPKAYKKAIHDSWNSLFLLFGGTPHYEILETQHLTTLACNTKISMFNRVMRTRLSPDNADEKIQETIDYFSSKELPFRWQIDPGDTPSDLPQRLENHSFSLKGGPGMALVIDELRVPKNPDGFRFEKVTTQEMNETFCRLLPEAYGMPEFARDDMAQMAMSIGIRDDYCNYLGFLDDKPVATSSVFYSDGVAGIYNVANLPEGRGIGSIMSAVPLFDARDLGYKVSILHSTTMGYNMYKRLGFDEYCRHDSYEWTPQSR